jgi:hypothetical protein
MSEANKAMTAADLFLKIPEEWRIAEITIGDDIERAHPVKRVALHQDLSGRRVVVLYKEPIEVKE